MSSASSNWDTDSPNVSPTRTGGGTFTWNRSTYGNRNVGSNGANIATPRKRPRWNLSRNREYNFFGRSNDSVRCENIALKVLNRQHCGYFSTGLNKRSHKVPYREVPEHLSFCLKEIVPYCYLQGHVFMGLTACGQFLISYKVSYDYDEVITNEYNFSSNYKYELYFWIYRPHFLLSKYFHVCLFDDHGVDDIKTVSITQWKTDRQLLVVHGASEKEDCDSYMTLVRVPRLGCLECRQVRDANEEDVNRVDILCIRCNMTIHTKYRNSDSGPKFNPRYNLNCPGYIIMSESSFIHTINIKLDMSRCPDRKKSSAVLSSKYISKYSNPIAPTQVRINLPQQKEAPNTKDNVKRETMQTTRTEINHPQISLSIADQIIADFAEYETENYESKCSQSLSLINRATNRLSSNSTVVTPRNHPSATVVFPENFDELVITCDPEVTNPSRSSPSSIMTSKSSTASGHQEPLSPSSNVRLMDHRNHTNIELRVSSSNATTSELIGPDSNHKSYVTRIDLQTRDMDTPMGSNNLLLKPQEHNGIPSSSSASPTALAIGVNSGRTPLRRRSYLSTRSTESSVPNEALPAGSSADVAAKAYEFSEDTERCEKISIFRKRRLADKKYEFSEDSSHGDSIIVPFNRLRNEIRTRNASHQNFQICSPSHQGAYDMANHLHRASPNHGFRSPCGSPVGNRYLRSPPGIRSPNYYRHHSPGANPLPTTSSRPGQSAAAHIIRMTNFDPKDFIHHSGNGSEEIPRFFIDAIQRFNEKKLQVDGGQNENINSDNLLPMKHNACEGFPSIILHEVKGEKKPICSKKIVKIFVEEDDANSVLTTEEDDCISPGYHASLPMEVHGSCYSNMQIITPASYSKLSCPAVIVTQNSFDMETFSFHVASYICEKNDKKYGILFDSAYELTHVCPLTDTITCTMVLQFTASDANIVKQCHNCSNTIDCRTHRKIYQCRSLFTWNMTTGNWTVLDYGNLAGGPYLELKKLASNYNRLLVKLRKFTRKLFVSSDVNPLFADSDRTYEYLAHLRVLDSNNEKTKQHLVDLLHMIEFYRKPLHNNSDDSDDDDDDDASISSVGSSHTNDDGNTVALTSDTVSDEDDI
ncbi:uncharacterized protein LOC129755166 [Uranotaenia lowii]|uniref:uncharacterized protein LOC129755166 n=1 Tax=Uranotaenia lowii TaxID=190385 RepID=UPI0024790562|nr:uncharacterized protein LOC129755166 [Uranotaenia lowii]